MRSVPPPPAAPHAAHPLLLADTAVLLSAVPRYIPQPSPALSRSNDPVPVS